MVTNGSSIQIHPEPDYKTVSVPLKAMSKMCLLEREQIQWVVLNSVEFGDEGFQLNMLSLVNQLRNLDVPHSKTCYTEVYAKLHLKKPEPKTVNLMIE